MKPSASEAARNGNAVALSAPAQLGKKIFFDPSMSGSGKLSCASCHSPAHAYGPPNRLAIQLGGPTLQTQGLRAVPSLRYVLGRTPVWSKQFIANPGERLTESDSAPVGGFAWDGRFNTLHDQAQAPLLAPDEMANSSIDAVVAKLKASPYASDVEQLYGRQIWQSPDQAFKAMLLAIESFELNDPSFHPFSSKFDQVMQGKSSFTPQELRGLKLFADPDKGNCASCHLTAPGADQSPPLFTDFSFSALGVPRNPNVVRNRDPQFFDLGLCGPLRTDQVTQKDFCGMFKTPTLRNVATRAVFMHNGRFTDLESAVRFYVERDTKPERWYPKDATGKVDKFNDLPKPLRRYVDVFDAPLNRKASQQPALTAAEIKDVVAFLGTLSDAPEN